MASSRLAVSRAGPAKNHLKHTALNFSYTFRRKRVFIYIFGKNFARIMDGFLYSAGFLLALYA
jgi:hypothetical protein